VTFDKLPIGAAFRFDVRGGCGYIEAVKLIQPFFTKGGGHSPRQQDGYSEWNAVVIKNQDGKRDANACWIESSRKITPL
jgi:hypothetical protein